MLAAAVAAILPLAACAPPTSGEGGEQVSNKKFLVYNNLIYNPTGQGSPDQQLAIPGPFEQPDVVPALPRSDDDRPTREVWAHEAGQSQLER